MHLYKTQDGKWVEVEPYQNGWIRYYTLRSDIKNRNDAHIILQLLEKINSKRFCRKKDFLEYSYKHKKWVDIKQPLLTLTEKEYNTLSDRQRKYFNLYKHIYPNIPGNPAREEIRAEFTFDYFFIFTISENIVTHHWIPDAEWQARTTELFDYLFTNRKRSGELDNILGRKTRDEFWGLPKKRKLDTLGKLEIREYLDTPEIE